MKPRSFILLAAVVVGAAVIWVLGTRDRDDRATAHSASKVHGDMAPGSPGLEGSGKEAVDSPALGFAISELNAAEGTVERDIQILDAAFEQWQTNFPAVGNPVGTNSEITAALTGANPLGLDLIPAGHPAINAAGELCDRWGTPFRFHQLSGSVMEISSAGPDRKFATVDDVVSH